MRSAIAMLVAFAVVACGDNSPPAAHGFLGINPALPGSGASGGTGGGVSIATTPLEISGSTVRITTTGAKEGYGAAFDGSAWGVSAPVTAYKTDVLIEDEFLNGGISNAYYTAGTAGAGAGCATNGASIAATTHPGINACSTGTTSTGRASALSGTSSVLFGGGVWTFETIVGFSALSSGTEGYAFQTGFMDATSVSQVDGCYFEYDERNAAAHNASNVQKWIAVCSSNSVRTAFILDGSSTCEGGFGTSVNQAVSALTLPNTNWAKLKVVVNAAATQADFYVNDVASCRITTNIPTGVARTTAIGWLMLKSVGATATFVDIDWLRVKVALTSARL